MGKRGPPKTPAAIKQKRGTTRRDRDTDDRERGLTFTLPSPPDHLSDKAREAWELLGPKLVNAELMTELDAIALEVLCESYAGTVETTENLKADNLIVYAGKEKTPMANPLVGVIQKNLATLKWAMVQFGLTPAARNAIKPPEKKEDDDPMGQLLGG